jgi:VWFA-related protein
MGQEAVPLSLFPQHEPIANSTEENRLSSGTDYALSFDGGDRVIVPDHISLNPSEITVECWVKFRRLAYGPGFSGTDAQTLIVKGGDRTAGVYELQQEGKGPDDYYAIFRIDPFSRRIQAESSTRRWQLNNWYHLAGTYDGRYLRIYVNGELKGQRDVGKITLGNTSPLYFGFMDVSGFPYYLDGVMDEVRIWSYARSEAEIQTTMYCLPTGKEVGLLGYWNFDEGTGQSIHDLTGNQNHGQLGTSPNADSGDPTWVLSDRPVSGEGLLKVNITAINPTLFPKVSVTARIVDTTGNAVTGLDTSHIAIWEDGRRQQIESLTSGFFDSTKADFVFVFDTTVSMQPQIDAVKNRVRQFADKLKARGIDYALGLVPFGDDYRVFNRGNLTRDVAVFQRWIDSLRADGGGDIRENPFDALVGATTMAFRTGAQKIFIMITDAPPHTSTTPGTPTKRTLKQVVDSLKAYHVTCYVVGPREPEYLGTGSLSQSTGGKFFDIGADFGGILDEIATFITGQYEIKFTTTNKVADGSLRTIWVRTAYRCRSGGDTSIYRAPDKIFALRAASDSARYPYGSEFWIEAVVDSSIKPAKGLFGISFALTHDKTALEYMASQAGTFLGTNPLFNVWPDEAKGRLQVAISKTSGVGAAGGGAIARFKFRALPQARDSVQVNFCFADVFALDSVAVQMPVVPQCLKVTLVDTTMPPPSVTVWPGDTNNDGWVKGDDILSIGLHWAMIGPQRPNASTDWIGQPCPVWIPKEATYADANGDGVVNQTDISVVDLNWGKQHGLSQQLARQVPPIVAQIATTWHYDGNILIASVDLLGIERLSGVALEWRYPFEITEVVAVEPGNDFGAEALLFSRDDPEAGRLSLAVGLKGVQKSLSGNCQAVTIRMRAKSDKWNDLANRCRIESAQWLNVNGERFSLAGIKSENTNEKILPTEFHLWQNYPNPFNPATKIRYDLPEKSRIVVRVFDVAGRVVRTLKNEMTKAGSYEANWDGRDDKGLEAASGVYLFKIETEKFTAVRKGILMR